MVNQCPWCLKTTHAPCAPSLVPVKKALAGRAIGVLYQLDVSTETPLIEARARLLALATKGPPPDSKPGEAAHYIKPTGGDVPKMLRRLKNCGTVTATDICYALRIGLPAPHVGHCPSCTCFRPRVST